MGSWHANIIFINRKKCVVFVNNKTLINFIITGLRKSDFMNLMEIFRDHLRNFLNNNHIPDDIKTEIAREYTDSLAYSPTHSKVVLGHLNDLVENYKIQMIYKTDISAKATDSIVNQLNRMPMGSKNYKYAIDSFNEMFDIK